MKPNSIRLPLIALFFALPLPTFAQQQPGYSQLDIRPAEATADLNAALTRLGSNPRDTSALIDAGEAALALNDPRAATGFFARADEIQSGNGRIKAGLGRAMLELQNPTEALRLFDQATRLGQPDRAFLSDRGLARDLTGDPAGAQRDYQAALRNTPGDEDVIRRYAISLGISGQVDAADKIVEPLLYKSDRAAWRNRAFVYAMNGRQKEAREITHKVMPQQLADQIQPYMDRMPGLTAAQRAAAVHFGTFPAQGLRMAAAPVVNAPAAAPPAPVAAQPARTPDRRLRSNRQLAQAQTQPPAAIVAAKPQPEPPAYTPDPQPARVQTPTPTPAPTSRPAPIETASVSRARPTNTTSLLDTTGRAASEAVAGDTLAARQLANARRSGERVNQRVGQRIGDSPMQIAAKDAAAAEAQRTAQADAVRLAQASTTPPARGVQAGGSQVQGPPAPDQPVQMATAEPPRQMPAQIAPVQQAPVQQAPVQQIQTTPQAVPVPNPVPQPVTPAQTVQPLPSPQTEMAMVQPIPQASQTTPQTTQAQTTQAQAQASPTPMPSQSASTPAPDPQATRTLADIIRELQVPEEEKQARVAAVDLSEVATIQQQRRLARQSAADKAKKDAVAKAKKEADEKAKVLAEEKARLKKNPARAWVQVGTGQSISALGFTMKGLRKKYDALDPKSAFSASWGRTNRLVVGPFASFAKARDFEAQLKKKGADAFAWSSDAGEEVNPL